MQGPLFEESFDGSDLGLHAGTAGEHRIDRLPRFRCKPRLAPERLGASPQSRPCRQVDRIGVRVKALPGDAPVEFHERPRTEPLHVRPQRVHGLAHPFAFVGCAGQPHARRIVELRSLALAEQPQSLAAKRLSRVDLRVQRFGRRRGRIQAMPAVPQERLDPAAGLLVIRAQPVHGFQGGRLGFRGPRLDRPADGFGELVAPIPPFLFLTSRGDQHASLRGLISTRLEIAVNAMLSFAQDDGRRIWVILDELPTLHQVPSLQPGLAESRQFGGCFVFGVQVASALRDLYGRNGAETNSGLCGTRVVLAAPDRDTAQWSADSLGRSEVEEVTEGYCYGANTIRDGVSLTPRRELRALALPSEILCLPNLHGYLKSPARSRSPRSS